MEESVSPLEGACSHRDIAVAELLLKYGARDDDCRALAVSVRNKDDILTAKLLSIKVCIYSNISKLKTFLLLLFGQV